MGDGEVWGPSMAWHGAFYPSMQPPTGKPTTFVVVDRINGGIVAKYSGPNFCKILLVPAHTNTEEKILIPVYFHTINAFDDPVDGDICIDLAVVESWKIMDAMYLDKMRSGNFLGSLATRTYRESCKSTAQFD